MEHLGMGTPQNLVCRDFILSSRKPKIFLDLFGHLDPIETMCPAPIHIVLARAGDGVLPFRFLVLR
jgi:hypothetical protein